MSAHSAEKDLQISVTLTSVSGNTVEHDESHNLSMSIFSITEHNEESKQQTGSQEKDAEVKDADAEVKVAEQKDPEQQDTESNFTAFFVRAVPESLIPSDHLVCGYFKTYPRFYPKSYITSTLITNILRILGLFADFKLFISTLKYNHNFMFTCNNNDDCSPEPFLLKKGDHTRFWLTFLMPIVLYVMLMLIYVKHMISQNVPTQYWLYGIFSGLMVLLFCFIYKLLMIFIAILRMFKVFPLCKKTTVSGKMRTIDRGLTFIFILESVLSSYPLWVLSLIELQQWYSSEIFVQFPSHLISNSYHFFLIIKVVCSGILIILNCDKVGKWIRYADNPKKLTIECRNDPYNPMRLVNVDLISDDDDNNNCSACGRLLVFQSLQQDFKVFGCFNADCHQLLCVDCGWILLLSYKNENVIENKQALYHQCETKLQQIYYPLVESDSSELIQPLIASNAEVLEITYTTEEIKNNKKCKFGTQRCRKSSWNFLILATCYEMWPAFHIVWIENADNKYSKNYLVIDLTLFFMLALVIRLLLIFVELVDCMVSGFWKNVKELNILIKWLHNISAVFYLFGFFMGVAAMDSVSVLSDSAILSMLTQCLIVGAYVFSKLLIFLSICYKYRDELFQDEVVDSLFVIGKLWYLVFDCAQM